MTSRVYVARANVGTSRYNSSCHDVVTSKLNSRIIWGVKHCPDFACIDADTSTIDPVYFPTLQNKNLLTSRLKYMETYTTLFFLLFSEACCVSSTAISGGCVNTTSIPQISSRTVNSTSKNGMLMKSRCPVNRTSNFSWSFCNGGRRVNTTSNQLPSSRTVNRTSKTERINKSGRSVNTTSSLISPSRRVNTTSRTARTSQSGCHVNMTSLASVSAYVLC